MPAIQLAYLKQQAARIAENWDDPAAFLNSLINLLEDCADYSRRAGTMASTQTLMRSYQVPLPVLRRVLAELRSLAIQRPSEALAVCDSLWTAPVYETRWLAANLISLVPPQPPQAVLERIRAWLADCPEERLVNALVGEGLSRLRQEALPEVLDLVQDFLSQAEPKRKRVAFLILRHLALDPSFQNTPALFQLLAPYLTQAPAGLRPDILEVLAVLARRFPQETGYVLCQALESPEHPDTAWLIRQVLAHFPTEIQQNLRRALFQA